MDSTLIVFSIFDLENIAKGCYRDVINHIVYVTLTYKNDKHPLWETLSSFVSTCKAFYKLAENPFIWEEHNAILSKFQGPFFYKLKFVLFPNTSIHVKFPVTPIEHGLIKDFLNATRSISDQLVCLIFKGNTIKIVAKDFSNILLTELEIKLEKMQSPINGTIYLELDRLYDSLVIPSRSYEMEIEISKDNEYPEIKALIVTAKGKNITSEVVNPALEGRLTEISGHIFEGTVIDHEDVKFIKSAFKHCHHAFVDMCISNKKMTFSRTDKNGSFSSCIGTDASDQPLKHYVVKLINWMLQLYKGLYAKLGKLSIGIYAEIICVKITGSNFEYTSIMSDISESLPPTPDQDEDR
jgi:hypothetical protein